MDSNKGSLEKLLIPRLVSGKYKRSMENLVVPRYYIKDEHLSKWHRNKHNEFPIAKARITEITEMKNSPKGIQKQV